MDIGNPEIKKVVEQLNYDLYFDKINSFNTINRIPTSIKLNHNWTDTLLHFYVGEWLMFISLLGFVLLENTSKWQNVAIMFAILSIISMCIPRFRKSMQFHMELTETEFIAAPFRFKWESIQTIYKIQTTQKYPKYGVKLILFDQSEINIDLALRKPSFGNESDVFHYIYVFWKRGSRQKLQKSNITR